MEKVRDLYDSRVEEINLFFDFLDQIIDKQAQLALRTSFTPGAHNERNITSTEIVPIQNSVINTMKANCFLLLYNLVECTIRQSITAVNRHIDKNDHAFDELQINLQTYFVKLLRGDEIQGVFHKQQRESSLPLVKAILRAGFESNKIAGNISFKTIKELSSQFGFNPGKEPLAQLETKIEPLKYIKDKRNELAHGELAFLSCGSVISIDELKLIKDKTVHYLDTLLENIEKYLHEKKYLK